jgi:hypothetical protein
MASRGESCIVDLVTEGCEIFFACYLMKTPEEEQPSNPPGPPERSQPVVAQAEEFREVKYKNSEKKDVQLQARPIL